MRTREEPMIGPLSIVFEFCRRVSGKYCTPRTKDIIPEIVVATAKIIERQARGREVAFDH